MEVNQLLAKKRSGKFIVLNKVQTNLLYDLKQTIMNDINDAYNDDRKYYCKSKKQIV
jgi:hypothetical protein